MWVTKKGLDKELQVLISRHRKLNLEQKFKLNCVRTSWQRFKFVKGTFKINTSKLFSQKEQSTHAMDVQIK